MGNLNSRIYYEKQILLEKIGQAEQALALLRAEVQDEKQGVIPSLGALQFAGTAVDIQCGRVALLIELNRANLPTP